MRAPQTAGTERHWQRGGTGRWEGVERDRVGGKELSVIGAAGRGRLKGSFSLPVPPVPGDFLYFHSSQRTRRRRRRRPHPSFRRRVLQREGGVYCKENDDRIALTAQRRELTGARKPRVNKSKTTREIHEKPQEPIRKRTILTQKGADGSGGPYYTPAIDFSGKADNRNVQ